MIERLAAKGSVKSGEEILKVKQASFLLVLGRGVGYAVFRNLHFLTSNLPHK